MTASVWDPNSQIITQANAAGLVKTEYQIAEADQVTFTLGSFAYAPNTGSLLVFKNGDILVKDVDYTEVDEVTVLLLAPASVGDVIVFVGFVGTTGVVSTDSVLRADLIASSGSSILGFLQSGAGMVGTSVQGRLRTGAVYLTDGMTAAQRTAFLGATFADDLSSVYEACYAACVAEHMQMIIPAGGGRITRTLNWNQSVDVIGLSFEFCVIKKDATAGDFPVIHISGAAQQSRFQDLTVTAGATGITTEVGIYVTASARMKMDRIQVDRQGGHAFWFHDTGVNGMGVFSRYTDLVGSLCGGDALRMDYQYASRIDGLNASQCQGYGHYNTHGNSVTAIAIICENNVLGGTRLDNCVANIYNLYGEANTGSDMLLTGSSTRNLITTYHLDSVADLSDEGTNNVVIDIGLYPTISCPNIVRAPRQTNVAGRDMYISAGTAGAGATGHKGGKLTQTGGDANGSTLAKGGDIQSQGGNGIANGDGGDNIIVGGTPNGTGKYGAVVITNAQNVNIDPGIRTDFLDLATSKSMIRVGGLNAVNSSVSLSLQSTDQFMQLNKMNNTAVLALDTTDGQAMFGFNQTAGKLCPVFFDGVAWQKVSFTAM